MPAANEFAIVTRQYRETLEQAAAFLDSIHDRTWSKTVRRWLAELSDLQNAEDTLAYCRHVERSWLATAGMGSLGDLTIGEHNGHVAPDPESADRRWRALVQAIYVACRALSSELGCPPLTRERHRQ